jgi:hypothetical protein
MCGGRFEHKKSRDDMIDALLASMGQTRPTPLVPVNSQEAAPNDSPKTSEVRTSQASRQKTPVASNSRPGEIDLTHSDSESDDATGTQVDDVPSAREVGNHSALQ